MKNALESPIVKAVLTILATGLAGTVGVPSLAAWSPILAPIGTFLLGALHVQRPGDVKPAKDSAS